MATRWRWPPESLVGQRRELSARPTRRRARALLAGARLSETPGVEEAVGHVVEDALVLGQEELLEHEADPGRSQRRELPVGQRGHVETGDRRTAGGRAVKGAHQMEEGRLARP